MKVYPRPFFITLGLSLFLFSFPSVGSEPDDKRTSKPRPGTERRFRICGDVSMIFCWIPPGECALGSTDAERAAVRKNYPPIFESTFPLESHAKRGDFQTKGYWLAKFPVTQRQYKGVTGTNPSHNDSRDEHGTLLPPEDLPVNQVSWNDAQRFVQKCQVPDYSCKLPHEDEWEYACRGGKGNRRAFYWGSSSEKPGGGDQDYFFEPWPEHVRKAAKSSAHPWGLCLMSGHIWQWCDNVFLPGHAERILRGGHESESPDKCRSAFRGPQLPNVDKSSYGFRLLLMPLEPITLP